MVIQRLFLPAILSITRAVFDGSKTLHLQATLYDIERQLGSAARTK
jgi:hypothetical protein